MQAINVFGPDVFKRYNGSKYQGGFDTTLWDTVMLTLERYDRADLQPKADALRAELEHLKGKSSFVPKAGENLSRRGIEARIGVFKNSIDAVIGMQRHADQNRLFSREIKVITHVALQHNADMLCLCSSLCGLHGLLKTATLACTLCKKGLTLP